MDNIHLLLDSGLDLVKRTVSGLTEPNIYNTVLLLTFCCQVSFLSQLVLWPNSKIRIANLIAYLSSNFKIQKFRKFTSQNILWMATCCIQSIYFVLYFIIFSAGKGFLGNLLLCGKGYLISVNYRTASQTAVL